MRRSVIIMLLIVIAVFAALPLTTFAAEAAPLTTCPHTSGRYYLPNVAVTLRDGQLMLVDLASRTARTLEGEISAAGNIYWGQSCRFVVSLNAETGRVVSVYDALTAAPLLVAGR